MHWAPTPAEAQALRIAWNRMGRSSDWLWRDDVIQAARICLWQTSDKRRAQAPACDLALAITYAATAMRREARRLTERMPGQHGSGQPVEFAPLEGVPEPETAGPDYAAWAAERLRLVAQVEPRAAHVAAAMLQGEDGAEAAMLVGMTHATFRVELHRARKRLATLEG
jgi:DNA-directed RNA polymerase specialized sigma24 family protein